MPKIPFWVFILIALLHFSAVRLDTMDVDASQYAEMSREMAHSDNWLWLYDRGSDYLDKPPFLFWASALSMKVFGVNNFGYKFPSILFALFAIYATYRLARLLYEENTARMAALILGACQGMFLMTNDVRTDTILMGWVIGAVWMIREWELLRKSKVESRKSKWYFLGGCACIAFGMMTKGPIALMVPVFCFATDWILKREWKKFLQPVYILGIILIAVLLVPMSIGLYQQFDLHPGKMINGQAVESGLRFFYWSQSFGRLTGESPWSNGAPFEFLLMNMFWAFLPWILLFIVALVLNIVQLFRQKLRLSSDQEWITMGGFVLTYLALGSSKYQLPHYIFVVFPLCAIITAKFLKDCFEGKYKGLFTVMKPVQIFVALVLFIGAALTFMYVFEGSVWNYIIWIAGVLLCLWILFSKQLKGKILWVGFTAIMVANVLMTHHFYPTLLKYQLGSSLGRFIHEQHEAAGNIYVYKSDDPLNALPFYAERNIGGTAALEEPQKGDYLVTMQQGLEDVNRKGINYEIIKQGDFFKVSELTPEFLNPITRPKAVKHYYFIRIR